MADPIEAFSTLDDFLLSLADGVSHAQQQLSRSAALATGGQRITYQLPRVDFELKMNLRVVEDQALSLRYRDQRTLRANDKHLLFKPLAAEEAASTLEIAAVIKGAFLAVPANNGLPGPVLDTAIDASDPRALRVRVTLRNAAGEPLAGAEVQFNLDREASTTLTAQSGGALVLHADTRFERGVVLTDATGRAESVLRLGAGQGVGLLALVVDALDASETLIYEVKAP
ncbi:MAG TPA: hypothetical protein VMG12_00225 [Polyangiaceae bacterium]|nr:hypothetical protein [Polyangiaceae bacterium]